MTDWDRRHLLALLGASGAGLVAGAPVRAAGVLAPRNIEADPKFATTPFTLGVAAGDPAADGFVIWTRLAPQPLEPHGGMVLKPVPVVWEVAEDAAFAAPVQSGTALAHPEMGHSVHVEVAGLRPDRPYWYRFRAGREESPVGRGRTLPAADARPGALRFVAAGCQHYEDGYYSAWRHVAQEPADFVFHYGDYIYEGAGRPPKADPARGRVRSHAGGEIYSLDDYRRRYAQYKADPDLQAAHAAAPWFVSFDDHEVDNNWAGDTDQDGTPPEVFAFRRAAAMQAYYEHMPLRRSALPQGGHMQMFRSFRYGDLMTGFVLDTRQYRSDQCNGDKSAPQTPEVFAENRTMMGDRQEAWLFDGIAKSDTRWNLIAHQVMLLNLARQASEKDPSLVYSMDQWSGYMNSRRRLLAAIERQGRGNVVAVSGDAHRHYAGDLIQDRGNGAVLSSEFVATSITSGSDGVGEDDFYTRTSRRENPHLKALTDRRGYLLCTVTRDAWQADLKILDKVTVPDAALSSHARFVIERGKPGLHKA